MKVGVRQLGSHAMVVRRVVEQSLELVTGLFEEGDGLGPLAEVAGDLSEPEQAAGHVRGTVGSSPRSRTKPE